MIIVDCTNSDKVDLVVFVKELSDRKRSTVEGKERKESVGTKNFHIGYE